MKRFRGWEPTTYHAYDRGRLVSSTPDVEWDEREQAWMLALAQYRASRCPRCSGDIAVTADPKNEGRFRHEPPVQCFRCLAFARAEDAAAGEKHAHTLLQIVPRKPNVK